MTVNLNSSTIYGLASDAPQAGISASAFTNAELFAGQSVQVIGIATAAGVITAQEVDLKAESVTGTLAAVPQGAAPDFNFTLQLTGSSYLTTYQKLAALNVSTNAQTEYGNNLSGSTFASTAAGTSLDVHGYLLMNAQGNFQFYASDISQTETPEPPEMIIKPRLNERPPTSPPLKILKSHRMGRPGFLLDPGPPLLNDAYL